MVDSAIVIIVLVVSACTRTVTVFVRNSIVVMIKWVLISKIETANLRCRCDPRVNRCRNNESICGNISGVESLCFKCCVIDRSLENTVVVIIPVIDIKNAVVVVVEWVGPVATVKSLN